MWWYIILVVLQSQVIYNAFIDMEHMEDVAGCNEDVVNDQEIRDDHDNEDEHAISHDHEDDPTIDDDGAIDKDDQGISTIING